jgi:hypothetical protein
MAPVSQEQCWKLIGMSCDPLESVMNILLFLGRRVGIGVVTMHIY